MKPTPFLHLEWEYGIRYDSILMVIQVWKTLSRLSEKKKKKKSSEREFEVSTSRLVTSYERNLSWE